MKDHGNLLTVREAAARLGLKPQTIRKLIMQRRIDCVRPLLGGRAVRIPEAAIEKAINGGYRAAVAVGQTEAIP